MIVTIDGPAGSGKSTASRLLAERLGFQFLDTGAMYRAVALHCLFTGIPLDDASSVAEGARSLSIEATGQRVHLNGADVTDAIRTSDVSNAASRVAANPAVRETMVQLQRQAAAGRDTVTEGRDQGTVVFPQAECKFYITAVPEERARRRQSELAAQGETVAFEDLLSQILERDNRDETRSHAPMRQASDALLIDTSSLSPDELVDLLESIVHRRMSKDRGHELGP